MHLTLPRSAILQAVQRCQSIVEKRHTVPILSNILLEANNSNLRITANDLEVGLRTGTQADIKQEGATTVSARKLFEVLKELDDESEVELHAEASFMQINSGRSKFRLAILSAEDFPAVQEDVDSSPVQIDGQDLAEMIAAISFAMSHDETRKYLTGTLMEMDESGHLRLVATDGHRLAMTEASIQKTLGRCQSIVPRKAVMEVRRLSEEVQEQVQLYLGQSQVRLEAGPHCLTTKLIDARFPAYSDVIPTDNPETAVLSRNGLDQVLRRSMVVANEFTHDVRLQFRPGEVLISAHNTEQEEAEESIAADYSGPELEIGFNARYLRDVLGVLRSDQVRVEIKDGLSPVLLLEDGGGSSRYVIMPMRI